VLREDLIERMIRQLAQALDRILGLRRRRQLDEADEEVTAAVASLGRIDPALLDASDTATLAALAREPSQLLVLARLSAERAEIRAEGARDAEATRWRRKAVELWLEAALAGAALDGDALRWVTAFGAAGEALSPRHSRVAEDIRRRGSSGA
jgi:hypothetical protein